MIPLISVRLSWTVFFMQFWWGLPREEGLKFNRAFLALFDGDTLQGKLAIGPACREDAGKVWENIKEKNLKLNDIITLIRKDCLDSDVEVNRNCPCLSIPPRTILIFSSVPVGDEKHTGNKRFCNRHGSIGKVSWISFEKPTSSLFRSIHRANLSGLSSQIISSPDNHHCRGHPSAGDFCQPGQPRHWTQPSVSRHGFQNRWVGDGDSRTWEKTKTSSSRLNGILRLAICRHNWSTLSATPSPPSAEQQTPDKRTNDPNILKFSISWRKRRQRSKSILEDLFSFVEEGALQKTSQSLHALLRKASWFSMDNEKKWDQLPAGPCCSRSIHWMWCSQNQTGFFTSNSQCHRSNASRWFFTSRDSRNGEDILITIMDSGVGVSDENIGRITDPFLHYKDIRNRAGFNTGRANHQNARGSVCTET